MHRIQAWNSRLCRAATRPLDFVYAFVLIGLTFLGRSSKAVELHQGGGWEVRWISTLRYSSGVRLAAQDAALLSYPNGDDGGRNFAPGLIANRFDLTSALEAAKGDFGLRISAFGWYDSIYRAGTDNTSPATSNVSTAPVTEFADSVRGLHGKHGEIADAFIRGSFTLAGTPVSLRLGRQVVTWGESLFYDMNSIASALAPTDHIRRTMSPNAYSNDFYLPVTQVSMIVQPLPDISVSFFHQFEWRRSRLPGSGSYLSQLDYAGSGGDRYFVGANRYLTPRGDSIPPDGGQYGVAIHARLGSLDLGFYGARIHAKDPYVLAQIDGNAPQTGEAGRYRFIYPEGGSLLGISFGTYAAGGTIAGELSYRRGAPLVNYAPILREEFEPPAFGRPDYGLGDFFHLQLSASNLLGRSPFWDSANFSVETSADQIVKNRIRQGWGAHWEYFSMKARLLFEPQYFQVLPNLDMTVPIGFGYNFMGRSFNYYAQEAGSGDFQIGLSFLYQSVWKGRVMLSGFTGGHRRQPLADRTFLMMSIERTF